MPSNYYDHDGSVIEPTLRHWELHENGDVIETCAVCRVCGQPTQTTSGICWSQRPTFLQRVGIWLFNLDDYFILVNRHIAGPGN